MTGQGSFKLNPATGVVDKAYEPVIKANRKVCGDPTATGADTYSGSNPLDFAWDDANKRLVECDGGLFDAVRSFNPRTGGIYWGRRLDGDAQTCTTVGKYTFVGFHRSSSNVNRFTYDYGNMGLIIGSKTGIQKVWQPSPDFTGGGANRDGRNNGIIASVVADNKLFVGGAFTAPKSKLAAFQITE